MADEYNNWRERGTEFERLATEERGAGGHRLQASAIPETNKPGDVATWVIQGAMSQKFSAHFELLGTEAGQALDVSPGGSSPLDYWLHRLYQHHCEEKSYHARPIISSLPTQDDTIVNTELPVIEDLCDASTAFCLWLQKRALERRSARKTVAERFQEWIEDNSSSAEPYYWSSPDSVRRWVTCVARGAKTPIPIDFLSSRLNVHRPPLLLTKCESLRTFFDQVAREEGLVWGVTQTGLWMAEQPPSAGAYIDAYGGKGMTAPQTRMNQKLVEAFIQNIWSECAVKVSKADFFHVAGYKDRTEFQRWQRGQCEPGSSPNQNFHRVLEMRPFDFVGQVEKKKLRRD